MYICIFILLKTFTTLITENIVKIFESNFNNLETKKCVPQYFYLVT